jgi:flagellin-specific chaperone FliS
MNVFDKDTVYIFGHAQNPEMVTGSSKDLNEMKNYLSALLDFVSKEMKAGKTKDEISAAPSIPNVVNVKEMWPGAMKKNLEIAYDYLEKSGS